MKKKLIAIGAAAVVLLSLAACDKTADQNTAKGAKYVIACTKIGGQPTFDFWSAEINGCKVDYPNLPKGK